MLAECISKASKRFLRLKNVSVLLITVYLICGGSVSEANTRVMSQVNAFRTLYKLNFILVGDFNMDPIVFKTSGWPDFLDASIIVPPM